MKAGFAITGLALFLLSGAACGPEKTIQMPVSAPTGAALIEAKWINGPLGNGATDNQVSLSFFTHGSSGERITDYMVYSASIYMKIHSHGGIDDRIKIRAGEKKGEWIIENFAFTMDGPWELRIWAGRAGREREFWEVRVEVGG